MDVAKHRSFRRTHVKTAGLQKLYDVNVILERCPKQRSSPVLVAGIDVCAHTYKSPDLFYIPAFGCAV
jgi:hypothetical protein